MTSGRLLEFRRGWPVVAASAAGAGLGVSGLLTYNSGLFVPALDADFGLSRGAFGLIFFATSVAMALTLPLAGRWIDRRGPVIPALTGAVALAAGFALLSMANSLAAYAAVMLGIGLLAVGSGPISYNRAVSTTFSAGRGLALGLTQTGIGVSAAVVPPLVTAVMIESGWRQGFLALAFLALVGVLPALLIRMAPTVPAAASDSPDFRAIASSPLFRRQLIAFVVMAVGFAGLIPHFVPMLRDAGISAATAAAYASIIGMAVIASRIVVGWLADVVEAAWLAAGACVLCALGCMLLAIGGPQLAMVGAIALGCAMGAEADLVGFMTARHFGVALFGRAYALQYTGFMLAAGAGPAWVGYLRDVTGSYTSPLVIASATLVVAAVLFSRLPHTKARHPGAPVTD